MRGLVRHPKDDTEVGVCKTSTSVVPHVSPSHICLMSSYYTGRETILSFVRHPKTLLFVEFLHQNIVVEVSMGLCPTTFDITPTISDFSVSL